MSNATKTEDPADFRIPVVRHFIACERIDTVASSKQYSLIDVIHAIKPFPGAAYPRIHPQLCLFAQMTNGRGSHSCQVQRLFLDDESTNTSNAVVLDIGTDPLIVHGWPILLKNVFFQRPGLYEFRLVCDAQVIAKEPIILRENP